MIKMTSLSIPTEIKKDDVWLTGLPGKYECSRHRVELFHVERAIQATRGQDRLAALPHYACPVLGCNYVKPDKWRKAREL